MTSNATPAAAPLGPQHPLESAAMSSAPIPQLRLELVESFVLVATERSLTRAAPKLFLTQPGLTRRLDALERTLGDQLLIRNGREVLLTPAGEAFLPYAQAILQVTLAGVQALVAVRQPGARNVTSLRDHVVPDQRARRRPARKAG